MEQQLFKVTVSFNHTKNVSERLVSDFNCKTQFKALNKKAFFRTYVSGDRTFFQYTGLFENEADVIHDKAFKLSRDIPEIETVIEHDTVQ